jgi:hypothetical protein
MRAGAHTRTHVVAASSRVRADGKRCGIGVYTYHDRTIYYGQWRSNVKEGFGVLVRSDGHVYEGYAMRCSLVRGARG